MCSSDLIHDRDGNHRVLGHIHHRAPRHGQDDADLLPPCPFLLPKRALLKRDKDQAARLRHRSRRVQPRAEHQTRSSEMALDLPDLYSLARHRVSDDRGLSPSLVAYRREGLGRTAQQLVDPSADPHGQELANLGSATEVNGERPQAPRRGAQSTP